MKQTAVEWLYNQQIEYPLGDWEHFLEQAIEIEKQQIIDAYKMGKYESDDIVMSDNFYAQQYYNETYKTKLNLKTK
jgi:hypothetical protein